MVNKIWSDENFVIEISEHVGFIVLNAYATPLVRHSLFYVSFVNSIFFCVSSILCFKGNFF